MKNTLKPVGMILFFGLLPVLLAVSCVQTDRKVEKAPARSCLDCHPEMGSTFKEGHVHAPVKEDRCDSCHLPHGLIGGLFLREQEPELCYSCHDDLKPSPGRQSVHQPVAAGTCSSCHEPHNSRFSFLLKAPAEESCFRCHDRSLFQKKFTHAPLAEGCRSCHNPHFSKNVSLLNSAPDILCRSCHQVDETSFIRAHNGYPVRNGCLQCHTPHAADRPMLLKKNVHDPVAKGQCDACHRVEKGQVVTRARADLLCVSCHRKPQMDRTSTHQPYLQKKCTVCHAVHASDYKSLLGKSPKVLCLDCHDQGVRKKVALQEEGTPEKEGGQPVDTVVQQVRSVHQPVAQGNCLGCHNGHDSNQQFLLRREKKALCTGCHEAAVFDSATRSHPPAQGRTCDTCHRPHDSANVALLIAPQARLCFGCHKREADERGRLSLHRPFADGNCIGCHQLHDPGAGGFLKQSDRNGALCLSCHEAVRKSGGNMQTHQPVVRGRCLRCHAPHSADFPSVIKQDPGMLCLSCHGNIDQAIQRSSVPHEPVRQGKCLSCHVAHGSPHDALLNKGQPLLCLTCHTEVAQFWRKGVAHKPAIHDCMQCHTAHGSNVQGMLNTGRGKLCGRCHPRTGKAFLLKHGNIQPGADSCISCHDAHGGPDKGLLYPVGHAPFLEGTCTPCHGGEAK